LKDVSGSDGLVLGAVAGDWGRTAGARRRIVTLPRHSGASAAGCMPNVIFHDSLLTFACGNFTVTSKNSLTLMLSRRLDDCQRQSTPSIHGLELQVAAH
jgi:hypothetical protein